MSLTGIVLGLLDILIIVVILLLVGAIISWVLGALGWPPPAQVQKLYIAVVALIALVMVIALLLGVPRFRIVADGIPTLRIISYAEGWSPAHIDWVSSGLWPGSCSRTEPVGIRQSLATAFAL